MVSLKGGKKLSIYGDRELFLSQFFVERCSYVYWPFFIKKIVDTGGNSWGKICMSNFVHNRSAWYRRRSAYIRCTGVLGSRYRKMGSLFSVHFLGSGYYYTLIAFSPTERLSVKGQLFKKTSLLRCLSVGNVIDDKLELDHLFLAIFRKAKMRSGYNSNLNHFLKQSESTT